MRRRAQAQQRVAHLDLVPGALGADRRRWRQRGVACGGFKVRHAHRLPQEIEKLLAVVAAAVEIALTQAFFRFEPAGVVGDRDTRRFEVGQAGLGLPADALLRRQELQHATAQRLAEVRKVALHKVVGIAAEELQVELKDPEAAAELAWVGCCALIARIVGGHVQQGLACDLEHGGPTRRGQQLGPVARKCLAAAVFVERVANAQIENALQRQALFPQHRPGRAGLLASNGNQHVHVQRGAEHGRFDGRLELLFEPLDVGGVGHGAGSERGQEGATGKGRVAIGEWLRKGATRSSC